MQSQVPTIYNQKETFGKISLLNTRHNQYTYWK